MLIIKILRLVRKDWSSIATEYILPEVHLIFKSESFRGLEAISLHPVISQHVKSLYYEPNAIDDELKEREEWEDGITDPQWMDSFPVDVPYRNSSERTHRAYDRAVDKWRQMPRHKYSEVQLDEAYKNYDGYFREQRSLCNRNYMAEPILVAMTRLLNLKRVVMTKSSSRYPRTGFLDATLKIL